MALDSASLDLIRPYVSNVDRRVFAITGLPEEVIAVLLAYYSRSREDLRTNLSRLIADDTLAFAASGAASLSPSVSHAQDKARAFHEKWVVGYGHASVAEHAVVHLAAENVSIIASKAIEDLRLGSYTEKSTRYVVFDTGSFAELPELPIALQNVYRDACANLFNTYLALFPIVQTRVDELVPRDPKQPTAARENVLRTHTCDLLRGLLPASTKTNLGLTVNARALATHLSKMMSSPIAEVRALGEEMRDEAQTVTPTLLRHAGRNEWRAPLLDGRASTTHVRVEQETPSGVRLLRHDHDAIDRVALALRYDDGATLSAADRWEALQTQPRGELEAMIEAALQGRGPYDPAPRALEASSVTAELTLDYGAYRDLQRHRMLSPFTQLLTCELGAEMPEELEQIGVAEQYRAALAVSARAWEALREEHPWEAQYAVPLAYRVRTLWTLNLRELFHVVELRSGKQGHASYRRIAQQLHDEVSAVHPWLRGLMRVDRSEVRLARGG